MSTIRAAAFALLCTLPFARPAFATNLSVTSTADSGAGSLRAVLAGSVNGDRITFAVPTPATITLTTGELVISKNITITGPGATNLTVNGNAGGRVFHITNAVTTISSLTITNGSASSAFGGGIHNDHSTLTLSNCVIVANASAGGMGGGIFNDGRSGSATLRLHGSTFSGNVASNGAAIYNIGSSGSATVTVSTCTFSGNAAVASGGALFNDGLSGSAALLVNASTISSNSAATGSGIFNTGTAGSGTLDIGDTILNNAVAGGNLTNVTGTVTSHGYNLSSDDAGGSLAATGDKINTDPLLDPAGLQNNGGPIPTIALLPVSPAIDQGKQDAIAALARTTDQRGFTRLVENTAIANATGGDASDIGAFEIQVFALFTATPTNGPSPLLVIFTDSSVGSVTNRTWNLGDGTIVGTTTTAINHTYTCGGPFTVSLSVLGIGGSNLLTRVAYISIIDTTTPVIVSCAGVLTNSANATTGKAAVPDFTISVSATDNCTTAGSLIKTQSPPAGDLVGIGTTNVTVTVTDAAGNTSKCVPRFTVIDITAPLITACPAAVTNAVGPNCQTAVPDFTLSVQATDNVTPSGSLVITQSPLAGTQVSYGQTPVTISVKDQAGNVATCPTSFTALDNVPPVITACAGAVTNVANAITGQAPVPDFTARVQGTDNCSSINALIKTQLPEVGSVVAAGQTTVTITVKDASGNQTTCSASFIVIDTTPPVISSCAPAVTNSVNTSCVAVLPDLTGMVVATDNVTPTGSLVKTQLPEAGTLVGTGTIPVIITVKDSAGNASTCNASFTARDTSVPTIVACAPALIAISNASGLAPVPDFTLFVQATDNCTASNALVKTQSPAVGTPVGVGVTQVVITVKDASGNPVTCGTTFTVNTIPVVANFNANPKTGRVPLVVAFSNLSTGTFAQTAWDFGDGGTSTNSNPSHTYTNPANFTVSLTVSGPGGTNVLSRANYITVTPALPPNITGGPSVTNAFMQIGDLAVVLAGVTNVFNVTAVDPGGNRISYQWQFGDGTTSALAQLGLFKHAYLTNCGPYAVSVLVSNGYASVSSNLPVTVACAMSASKPTTAKATLNFDPKKPTSDSANLTAILDIPDAFAPSGQVVTVSIGGAQASATLDKNGKGVANLLPSGVCTCRLTHTKPTSTKLGYWTLTASLTKGAWRDIWATHGLDNATHKSPGVPVLFPVAVLVGNEAFASEPTLKYTSTAGKTGNAK